MIAVLAMTLAWSSRSPDTLHGQATYYSPGVMAQVAKNRGMDLTPYLGGVALNRKGDLGRIVWIEFDTAIEGPFLVVDCAQEGHFPDRENQNRVIEVDAATAIRHGFYGVGPVPVKVFFDTQVTCTLSPCPI
jgi:hypothetical protein